MSAFIFCLLLTVSNIMAIQAFEPPHCCPNGTIASRLRQSCWVPKTNKTTSLLMLKDCKNLFFPSSRYIIRNGRLVFKVSNDTFSDVDREFCIANVTSVKDVNFTRIRQVIVSCADVEEPIIDDKILGYCMMVSVIFLWVTAVIYASFSELRDIQGKSIINFCSSLAIGLAILVIMKIGSYSDMKLCAARGFFAYFFIMASFFWANAISIQILMSTRNPMIMNDHRWRDFVWYAVYAWCCPIILTICLIVANYHPGDHKKPGIGLNHCWFFSKKEQWYYMYSIMSILLAINIFIFIYASTIIWCHNFYSHHLKAIRYKFGMTLRLVILMGLPWIFEMLGSVTRNHIIWTILDIFNTLQGLLIFLLLVVFRKKVIKCMYKRGWLDCISGVVEKCLAVADDDEDNVIQHTDVPMNEK